jgi:hypothetical protein
MKHLRQIFFTLPTSVLTMRHCCRCARGCDTCCSCWALLTDAQRQRPEWYQCLRAFDVAVVVTYYCKLLVLLLGSKSSLVGQKCCNHKPSIARLCGSKIGWLCAVFFAVLSVGDDGAEWFIAELQGKPAACAITFTASATGDDGAELILADLELACHFLRLSITRVSALSRCSISLLSATTAPTGAALLLLAAVCKVVTLQAGDPRQKM